ncbi:DNA polymerase, partial [Haematococcus lacustris]
HRGWGSGQHSQQPKDEVALLCGLVSAVQSLDPDVLIGWDIQRESLGYLVERAQHLGLNLLRALGRTPGLGSVKERQEDEWGALHASGIHATGRVLLNLWRLVRGEVKLNMYSFESCCAAVLRRRVPRVPHTQMAAWFASGPAGGRWRCLRALQRRASLNLALIDTLDLVGRTAEMARAFGIDFFSVLSRGSQYRVESLLVRLAHTQNYVMLSPSREQVGGQPAMEAIPLVMEPESRMYTSPVVVLDFQSLYPSQMIAYNLCYSTCLGRPSHVRAGQAAAALASADSGTDPAAGAKAGTAGAAGVGVRLGVTSYAVPPGVMTAGGPLDPDSLVIAPNGVAYAPASVRPGVLPRMLSELLNTRVMTKAAMKRHAADRVLQRVLNARQMGLKLISNVTYGYTSAGFSGRMPFAELADSIVQSGRQTLENAIRLVEGHPHWKARVVYGDTDSLFVLLPGRSREDAFVIGAEIAAAVTACNPPPVTLKMEKVYQPCILQTKKRYVGYAYESPAQTCPTFDAKGIETVRRDGCPAVAKLLEASLRLLFSTKDLS